MVTFLLRGKFPSRHSVSSSVLVFSRPAGLYLSSSCPSVLSSFSLPSRPVVLLFLFPAPLSSYVLSFPCSPRIPPMILFIWLFVLFVLTPFLRLLSFVSLLPVLVCVLLAILTVPLRPAVLLHVSVVLWCPPCQVSFPLFLTRSRRSPMRHGLHAWSGDSLSLALLSPPVPSSLANVTLVVANVTSPSLVSPSSASRWSCLHLAHPGLGHPWCAVWNSRLV